MEDKYFHVYKKRLTCGWFHITDIKADSLVEAINTLKNEAGFNGDYRVLGIEINTGHPYDPGDFPNHIRKRINEETENSRQAVAR